MHLRKEEWWVETGGVEWCNAWCLHGVMRCNESWKGTALLSPAIDCSKESIMAILLPPVQAIPLWQKAAAGLAAGGLGALVGNPADLTLIRMQVGG